MGHPKPLGQDKTNEWSRKITDRHRLVYVIEEKKYKINGVTVVRGDSNIDINQLKDIFTESNIDAATLRKTLWQRKI
ncbi:type II toxin-antitoxin system YoeB family toxin [Olivibacter jilunii]|uniref:type II toxin-antitoxin system YoeB family toxin n=1 Tax=Olivibacter jilunii TaxID=985016 RepID=UPI003F5CD163